MLATICGIIVTAYVEDTQQACIDALNILQYRRWKNWANWSLISLYGRFTDFVLNGICVEGPQYTKDGFVFCFSSSFSDAY